MCVTALWDHSVPAVQWTVVIAVALAGAGFDLATRRVPNLLSGTVLVAGVAYLVNVRARAGRSGSAAGVARSTAGRTGLPDVPEAP